MCSWSKNGPWVVIVNGEPYGPYTDRQAPVEAERLSRANPDAAVTYKPMSKAP